MNKEQCLARLDYISKLEYNWDSYKALPVPTIVINKAKELLELLKYANVDFISPYSGALQIELTKNTLEVEIEVEESSYNLLLCPLDLFSTWIESDNLTQEEVIDKVKEFFN